MEAEFESQPLCLTKGIRFIQSARRGREWLTQLVRSLPSNQKVPSLIPGFAENRIFVRPSPPSKLTQLSILPGPR